jgi:peptidoglycan/xylan/chitin deacetylase (PgdA/CDA1 family)
VLCYHTFLGKETIETDFSVKEFSEQITQLKSAGYTFVTLEQVETGTVNGRKNLLVMFDDGHHTAAKAYQQVMAPLGLPAVFAIFPAGIGSPRYMTWEEVKALAALPGNSLVVHGYRHEMLFDRFAKKHPQQFVDEFERAKRELAEKTGLLPAHTFVYPFGVISQSGKEQLAKSGYLYAYGLAQRPLKIPLSLNADPLALPRYMITRPIVAGVMKKLLQAKRSFEESK